MGSKFSSFWASMPIKYAEKGLPLLQKYVRFYWVASTYQFSLLKINTSIMIIHKFTWFNSWYIITSYHNFFSPLFLTNPYKKTKLYCFLTFLVWSKDSFKLGIKLSRSNWLFINLTKSSKKNYCSDFFFFFFGPSAVQMVILSFIICAAKSDKKIKINFFKKNPQETNWRQVWNFPVQGRNL